MVFQSEVHWIGKKLVCDWVRVKSRKWIRNELQSALAPSLLIGSPGPYLGGSEIVSFQLKPRHILNIAAVAKQLLTSQNSERKLLQQRFKLWVWFQIEQQYLVSGNRCESTDTWYQVSGVKAEIEPILQFYRTMTKCAAPRYQIWYLCYPANPVGISTATVFKSHLWSNEVGWLVEVGR